MKAVFRWQFAIVSVFAFALADPGPSIAGSFSEAIRTYASYCANCHGKWGHGDGVVAPVLKTKPKNLADRAVMDKFSDDILFKAIKEGGPAVGLSKDMPAWGEGLDDAQIKALVVYVRSMSKH